MKITHIYHSGFSVELSRSILLFDWYRGALPDFDRTKTLYVFVSHRHPDHYSEQIWKLRESFPQIHYILYKGICKNPPCPVLAVRSDESYTVRDLNLRTLLSTDEGVAFVATIEGHTIYHAGDLNLWYWQGEEEANKWQTGTYKAQINKLKGTVIDAAFLTLDPRQEHFATLGMEYFLKNISVRNVFPMHYWNEKQKAMAYLDTEALHPFREKIRFEEKCLL